MMNNIKLIIHKKGKSLRFNRITPEAAEIFQINPKNQGIALLDMTTLRKNAEILIANLRSFVKRLLNS